MKNHLLVWLIGWLALGCSGPTATGPVGLSGLRKRVEARYQRGDTLLVAPQQWSEWWPGSPGDWRGGSPEAQASGDPVLPFSWARRVYRQEGPLYLSLEVADYAADSSALYYLRQSWPSVSYLAFLPSAAPSLDASYLEHDPLTGATRLELIAHSRFVLSLQTNHPEGENQLRAMLQHLPWEQWPR